MEISGKKLEKIVVTVKGNEVVIATLDKIKVTEKVAKKILELRKKFTEQEISNALYAAYLVNKFTLSYIKGILNRNSLIKDS
ncbi:hypothetical protein SAMN02745135_01130 [Caloranaerobacter azorensis DSM 13643]|uniref:Uncharacterized protein n=1 Tax=Caloranaerobacter azorensis DSM 13643 TaxID=1121264 RepID=A0A1M5TU28_9FIRM|nr:hypothetical protein [Caloranaerobacter azorensis]SHH54140.1 hypothetical protein SAMN02745135_01130 [Caloranaerobacter azorensis DSM 13643]